MRHRLGLLVLLFGVGGGCSVNDDAASDGAASGGAGARGARPSHPEDISLAEADALLAGDDDVVVLDIRTPQEFAAGHIAGAIMLDCKADDFVEELGKLDRSKTYVVH